MKASFVRCPVCDGLSAHCKACGGDGTVPEIELTTTELDEPTARLWAGIAAKHLRQASRSPRWLGNITVEGDVGVFSAGDISHVSHVSTGSRGRRPSARRLKTALKELTAAVATDGSLSERDRVEAFELLSALEQLSKHARGTSEPGSSDSAKLHPMIDRLAMLLSAAGGAAEVWSTWGKPIRLFFGIPG